MPASGMLCASGISPHLCLQGCVRNSLNHKYLISLNFFFGQPLSVAKKDAEIDD
jgi:hypothetical protein